MMGKEVKWECGRVSEDKSERAGECSQQRVVNGVVSEPEQRGCNFGFFFPMDKFYLMLLSLFQK